MATANDGIGEIFFREPVPGDGASFQRVYHRRLHAQGKDRGSSGAQRRPYLLSFSLTYSPINIAAG